MGEGEGLQDLEGECSRAHILDQEGGPWGRWVEPRHVVRTRPAPSP